MGPSETKCALTSFVPGGPCRSKLETTGKLTHFAFIMNRCVRSASHQISLFLQLDFGTASEGPDEERGLAVMVFSLELRSE